MEAPEEQDFGSENLPSLAIYTGVAQIKSCLPVFFHDVFEEVFQSKKQKNKRLFCD